jgi:hypothetical protein
MKFVRRCSGKCNGRPDNRFSTMEGDIGELIESSSTCGSLLDTFFGCLHRIDSAHLQTMHGLRCAAVANATNRKFKGGGSGTNKALHDAAGPNLETDSVQLYVLRTIWFYFVYTLTHFTLLQAPVREMRRSLCKSDLVFRPKFDRSGFVYC